MNNLLLSGMISGNPTYREEANGTPHMIFTIGVRGVKEYEYFRVSVWNKAAIWAKDHLTGGMLVALHGRLHQHHYQLDGKDIVFVEITADEVLPMKISDQALQEATSHPIPGQQTKSVVQTESLSAALSESAAKTAEKEKEGAA